MNARNLTLLFAAATTLAASAIAVELKPGDPRPDAAVKMKNYDSRDMAIADVNGAKGRLVVFTCMHCPFVKAWEERLAKLGNEYAKQQVGVVWVNSNDPVQAGDTFEALQARAKKLGIEFPFLMDISSDVARAYGATRTPEAFLFDANDKLVYHGTVDDNYQSPADVKEHYLRDALAALVAGREIATKETKAVGCTIKFRAAK
jgi:peroxiredoxin